MEYLTIMIVALVALGVSSLTQLINKLLINEKYTDGARAKMKELQTKLKTVTDVKSKEFTQMQDEVLDINFNIMKQQMKPMIFTFVPYIFIYWLLAGAFAYNPVEIGSNMTVLINGHGTVFADCLELNQTINGSYEGTHILKSADCQLNINGNVVNQTVAGKKEIITQNVGGIDISITPPKNKILPLPVTLPYIGDGLGWLGTFVIFSLVFSVVLGKVLKGKYLRKWA